MSRRMTSFALLAILLLLGAFSAPIASADSPAPTLSTKTELATTETYSEPTEVVAQDGLFDGLASIFAVLGVYIVTMFTMAIAVEVVVDIFKVSFGMKSKPSARKTLAEYSNLLPGTLDDLGASAQAQAKLNQQIKAINQLLQPAFQAEDVIVHLRNKEFNEAFDTTFGAEAQGKWVNDARNLLKDQLNTAVISVETRSPLGKTVQATVVANLDKIIDAAAKDAANLTPEEVYNKSMVLVNGEFAQATSTWTEAKLNELQKVPYETAESIYNFQIKPEIEKSGLSKNLQDALDKQFTSYLGNLKTFKIGETYLDALNQLLLDVEKERYELYTRISYWWLRLKTWTRRQFSRIFPSLKNPPRTQKRNITIEEPIVAANRLMEIDERDKQENKIRISQLRFISVVVSIILAYFLKVDSADLLGELFSNSTNFLDITLLAENSALLVWLDTVFGIKAPAVTAGVLLTGLGASAGSNFWHQQLNRLEAIKQGSDAAQAALQPIIVQTQGTQSNNKDDE